MEIPENLPSSVWAQSWSELYKWFAENLRQEELDIMDSILHAVEDEARDEIARFSEKAADEDK